MVGYTQVYMCVCGIASVWGWSERGVGSPNRQQGLEEKKGRNCSEMTSEPQAQWRLWLQKPQQEGLTVCLAQAEWLQHRGLPSI